MNRTTVLLAAVFFTSTGSGCRGSGTWTDDPANWTRAFDEMHPADGVVIVHSWYMRTPHWTAEYAWFFELTIPTNVSEGFEKNLDVSKVADLSDERLRGLVYSPRPAWFLAGPLNDYEAFEMGKTDPPFLMFHRKGSSQWFWTRYQL